MLSLCDFLNMFVKDKHIWPLPRLRRGDLSKVFFTSIPFLSCVWQRWLDACGGCVPSVDTQGILCPAPLHSLERVKDFNSSEISLNMMGLKVLRKVVVVNKVCVQGGFGTGWDTPQILGAVLGPSW